MQSNKHYLLFLFLLLIGTLSGLAQEDQIISLPIKAEKDTIVAPLFPRPVEKDSISKDSTEITGANGGSPLLLDKIQYKAKDSIILSQKNQKIYLYNEAEIYYQDTELKAGIIIMDYVNNEVYAGRIKDSLGVYSQLPYFKQGEQVVIPDSIRFNFDSQKALIFNSRTEQQAGAGQLGSDAMKVYAEITKKENDSVYFMNEAKITTAEDTINPDYYIRVRKAKLVPGKKVIAGLSNIYIADVPTPIGLPFAYFPLSVGRTAGLLMPSIGNDPNRGYFLQNGGYYLPIGDNLDIELTGDFYTNGSWGIRSRSNYVKRYKYRGNINVTYQNLVTSQKGFSDFSRSSNYNIQISHSQDTKASPNSRFSASVNLGSSQFFQNSLGRVSSANLLRNNNSSSISYSKTLPAYPSINMSLTATHSQDTSPGSTDDGKDNIQMTLPTFQGSMERIFPFVKRDGIKKGIFQNINLQYDVNARYSLTTNDEDFLTGAMFENARFGARHRIPISTNFKLLKYLSVTMGGNYEDVWTAETFNQRFVEAEDPTQRGTVVRDTVAGFDRYNTYNFSASIGTTIYGTFRFGDDKKVQAIRHVMRPSISYGYAPSFDQFYDEYIGENGEVVQFSRFEGTLNGAPRLGKSNSLSFSLANTLEAKVRNKDSTITEPKKVPILSNFNISTGYNLEADSLKLSPLSVNGGTNILNNKMSINFSAGLDPYAIDNNGRRVNTFNIDNGGSLLRLTRANVNIGYRIDSEMFGKKDEEEEEPDEELDEEAGQYDYSAQEEINNPFEKVDEFGNPIYEEDKRKDQDIENPIFSTKIPWDFNLAYSATYNNAARQNEFGSHSIMVRGNIQLTPRWKVGGSTGYDFKGKGFTLTQLRLERKLGSFNLRFNWTPFGQYRRWDFFIGISSSILKDLKWENRSQPPRR
ncbi:LPS-assembly protein LptD [Maribacter algarum]|uniref:LPS-assembly protein LptD n=1 Tax=Maribacter algarum (ex Zhang et al. 2020) TaxID=2578118 RepID=A0A5S3PHR1_9FLAO|nr:putative LPS assembly protein LptD [Maribacter algarum]TMM53814.1 LPS-assembly protein LptD [Maribacter algarum]